ncbi:UNVERIFIED_CONTAM: hypothetical protein GTU68_008505, partial [Idotea baltica]|nr:hypothetical protein [Idotea baltica]
MSDNEVWAGGLLVFYEVFKHLELAMDRLKGTIIEKLDIPGMRRTAAFEKDLRFYLGDSWQSGYTPHPSVQRYLLHLTALESDQPVLLLPYIYHLYMGLFAGGQVLKKKRAMVLKLSFAGPGKGDEGLAVVNL